MLVVEFGDFGELKTVSKVFEGEEDGSVGVFGRLKKSDQQN